MQEAKRPLQNLMRAPFSFNAFRGFCMRAGCTKGKSCNGTLLILLDSTRLSNVKTKSELLGLERCLICSFRGPRVKVPEFMWGLTAVYNSSPKRSTILFLPPLVPGMHVMLTHTCRQNMHTLKNKKNFKTVVYRKESYCFVHGQPQAALEMRYGNGSKSVPAEEHLNTGQPLFSASQFSLLMRPFKVRPTWCLTGHCGLPFIMAP